MSSPHAKYRRDSRHQFPRGRTSINLGGPGQTRAEIANVSAAGIAMIVSRDAGVVVGAQYPAAVLSFGACSVRGEIVVRNVKPFGVTSELCGCLFYPASPAETERWMVIVTTVEAVIGD